MRKLFVVALTFASAYSMGQGNTLYTVETITPKMGKSSAFESKWKAHLAKFHGQNDSRVIHEILSGDNAGSFVLFEGPISFADMDNVKPNAEAHGLDYENMVSPTTEKVSGVYTYRWVDTLSYNGNMNADKFITTVYRLKPGKLGDLTAETKRALKVNTIMKSQGSYNTYIKLWAGSHPVMVVVSNLKDGFKQLDTNFNPSANPSFKDVYVKEFGQEMWDRRLKLLTEITESIDVSISKLRKDLSTPMK